MSKKILVVSHERSGTHFLINTIADHFNYSRNVINVYEKGGYRTQEEQVSNYTEEVRSFMNDHCLIEDQGKIYKSHHDIRFFTPEILRHFYVFYIYRNVYDTLTSCYHYYKRNRHAPFPYNDDVEKFLFDVRPSEYPTERSYSYGNNINNVVRWKNHIDHWLSHTTRNDYDVCYIQYENLVNNYKQEVNVIASFLGRTVTKNIRKPGLDGVSPRKGIVGDYKNLFTEDQVLKIRSIVNAGTDQ